MVALQAHAHVKVQPVVLGEREQQLRAQAIVGEHHARAAGDGVAQVQAAAAAAALLRQAEQVLQAAPLEAAILK